ncbi:hypothetical protein S245_062252, partial [Arachis hypogaea]
KAGDVCRTAVHQLSGHQERRRDEFTRMRLQLRIPAIERVFFTCEDSVQYFENGFHILKGMSNIIYGGTKSSFKCTRKHVRKFRFLQGLETDSATVKKIRQAIDNQTEVTVQLINYTKTDAALLSQHFKKLLEKARNDAEKKYDEINEQNKILHSHLEALHIRKAKKEHNAAGISFGSSSADTFGDAGLQTVMTCLRNSKEI